MVNILSKVSLYNWLKTVVLSQDKLWSSNLLCKGFHIEKKLFSWYICSTPNMRIKLTFCDFTESKFEEGEHELTNELCSSNRSDLICLESHFMSV